MAGPRAARASSRESLYLPPGPKAPARFAELTRRGIRFGFAIDAHENGAPRAEELWRLSAPVLLRNWGGAAVKEQSTDIKNTIRDFESFRAAKELLPCMRARLRGFPQYSFAGVTVDGAEPREIEKVHVNERAPAARSKATKIIARDLYAKLSWIAHDPRDASLRIRFSFGSERLRDWTRDAGRAAASDRYAEAAFPECAVITQNPKLVSLIERLARRRVRFSERILYSNAPGGGAVFHHDAETQQLGVAYAQLAGSTGWLALPKRELAGFVATILRRPAARVLRALDRHGDATLDRVLARSRPLVRALAEAGHFYRLHPGDVLLLPSNGPDDVAWHSVFALGARPSLALSFGIFAERR